MAQIKISQELAQEFMKARTLPDYQRRAKRKILMLQVHQMFPALGNKKIRLAVENPGNPLYLVVRDKRSGEPFDDGQATVEPVMISTATDLPKRSHSKKVAAPDLFTPAKKAVAKKAPAKVAAKKPAPKPVAAKKAKAAPAKPTKSKPSPAAAAKTKTAAKLVVAVKPKPKAKAR
jgi:hypothetical protein